MDACLCDPEQRTAFEADMSDAGVRWHMHVYGGVRHSFTNATLVTYRASPTTGSPPNTPARASWPSSNGR